ncbi:hypothetical protein [Chryseobacterium turcicum]|uniref:TonB C-terminal domain-containing protein n=1 Tax=Chryseobacterium turcicum TaxID=2898076 RepID=A0A9Q3V1G0_9FLAO|nr:hypothetical protein [Chryseobacterium turcicum]MCD1116086.1 hypothetical protein [Chryseobacterium turcicum]
MNQRSILFFVILIISFFSVSKINAQEKRKLMNRGILTEIKNIQNRFSDSVKHYDYKKDAALYGQKYKSFYGEKLNSLKELYQSIYDKEGVVGKIDSSLSFKTTNAIQAEKNTQTGITSSEEIKNKSIDITEVENFQQLQELQKQLTLNFPTYLVEELDEGVYRCKLTFIIDVDGKFKKVKYSEASKAEFGIISALFLYAIGGLEKPLLYNQKPIVQNFTQPIVLRFE